MTRIDSHHLRVLSFNTWHGLDHTKPKLMPPAESLAAAWQRRRAQIKALENMKLPLAEAGEKTLELFCLQEVNPVGRRSKQLAETLKMNVCTAEANVGFRIGGASFPPLLAEGLAILWRGPLTSVEHERVVLSGDFFESKLPLIGTTVSFQLSERRVAQILTGVWGGHKIACVNLHLHHGPSKVLENERRRLAELDALFTRIKSLDSFFDIWILCGDFNCFKSEKEYETILEKGFNEISLDATSSPFITWDPDLNPVCQNSLNLNIDPVMKDWDKVPQSFDHIFIKNNSDSLKLTTKCRRIFDEPLLGSWLSDHYGLCADIRF